jgi:hypothetical protein
MDRSFGERLEELAADWSVWTIDSDENRIAIEALWKRSDPSDITGMAATIGSRDHELPDFLAQFELMLDEVIEHFPAAQTIGVVGLPKDAAFCNTVLSERGFAPVPSSYEIREYRRTRFASANGEGD